MTLRPLPRSRLDRVVPPLVRESALVVLVPVGDETSWAAEAAWGVAQAAAIGSREQRRSVALADLHLEAPVLHLVKRAAPVPGIAEAFASETPLNEIEQEIDGVHFLPAGGEAPDPTGVRGSARWERLHAGFRSEDALLLVCMPAEELAQLGTVPDGIIALAPAGVDLGSSAGRALLAARERGIPLLGAVRERWTAPQLPVRLPHPPAVRPAFAAFIAVLAIVSVALLATAEQSFKSGNETAAATAKQQQKAVAKESFPLSALALPAADSGAWTLQVAAYGEPERAVADAERLSAAGFPAFVSPVPSEPAGAVWYRVQVGGYLTREAAAAARETCWRRGLVAAGEGQPLLAPYSLALRAVPDPDRLRETKLVLVRLGANGPVLIGAFERAEQAGVARAQLQRAGIATTLVTRTDRTP